ncbi:MAG: GCD complex subunit gcd7 [Icmadophila ericetorum]|nr:GCD complex subunit gcd7 [Icmadophila ericetorum]
MSNSTVPMTPGLQTFLKAVKTSPVESAIENLISLLKRRQIRGSRSCAIATARLMRRVVAGYQITDIQKLIERVSQVGQRLTAAQPREIAVGNIVRRVLGVIREEAEENRDGDNSAMSESTESRPQTPIRPGLISSISTFSPLRQGGFEPMDPPMLSQISSEDAFMPLNTDFSPSSSQSHSNRPPLLTSHTSYAANTTAPMVTSMFSLLSQPTSYQHSPTSTPGNQSPMRTSLSAQSLAHLHLSAAKDLRAEVIEGIEEIIDELDQVDDQIAGYALDHIHSNEIILTYTSSVTVQKFLLKAASKRKFTVIHAEAYPNGHLETHATVMGHHKGNGVFSEDDILPPGHFEKSLTAAGITVILIPDASIFALMSRVNKVILGTHVVLANGGLVAAAGTKAIAKAASLHRTPVVVLSGVYKLSPIYPFDFEGLVEWGDAGAVLDYRDGKMVGGLANILANGNGVDIENPLFDYVEAELVDLYITNLGGHAPSYLYRIVSDHYRSEDTNLAVAKGE